MGPQSSQWRLAACRAPGLVASSRAACTSHLVTIREKVISMRSQSSAAVRPCNAAGASADRRPRDALAGACMSCLRPTGDGAKAAAPPKADSARPFDNVEAVLPREDPTLSSDDAVTPLPKSSDVEIILQKAESKRSFDAAEVILQKADSMTSHSSDVGAIGEEALAAIAQSPWARVGSD
mmetsp:Transcript_57449/g.147733  ORF Transcript_57449/g.147733 Transcript_57449/m.147733 type:complete len:180 (-) Transcript_57449:19-558(-)